MIILNNRLTLDEVLDEFFYASEKPSAEKMKEVLAAYPEYRNDIVEFTALWASYENAGESDEAMVPSAMPADCVARLQSFVMGRLHELKYEMVCSTSAGVEAAKQELAGSSIHREAEGVGFFGASMLLSKVLTNNIFQVPRRAIDTFGDCLDICSRVLGAAVRQGCLSVVRSYEADEKSAIQQIETLGSLRKELAK